MVNQTASHDQFHELLTEHEGLMAAIGDLRKWWSEVQQLGIPRFGEMGCRLVDLRKRLKLHFAEEESGGYMLPVLAAAPGQSARAQALLGEHRKLLVMLDDFIEKLRATSPPFDCWSETCIPLDDFLTALHDHETTENALIQETFNDVTAAAD